MPTHADALREIKECGLDIVVEVGSNGVTSFDIMGQERGSFRRRTCSSDDLVVDAVSKLLDSWSLDAYQKWVQECDSGRED